MRLRPALAVALAVTVAPASALASFAPINRPGPSLKIPEKKLRVSLTCSKGVREAKREPVLLLPATTVDSVRNFGWNYERLLDAQGIPFCASDQQGKRSTNMTNVEVRGQYITYAIRRMHRIAGRRIAVMGHSQGGMAMRWSLRFWPDTRRMVDDVIGFAGTNHGSQAITQINCAAGCSAAFEQQRDAARFVGALNSRAETFRPLSYTEIFSSLDEVVTPPAKASSVSGPAKITNVSVQSLCPLDHSEHLQLGTLDPVASALAMDALTHRGPAKPSRVLASVCNELYMPGIDPLTAVGDFAAAAAQLAEQTATFPHSSEPRLACYTKRFVHRCRRARQAA